MYSSNTDGSLYLHAELLPNIRQITLYVSLPHALTSVQPTIQLSESCRAVTVSLPEPFQDVVETIKLPARVSDASRRALTTNPKPTIMHKPSQSNGPSHDYSFRMLIDAKEATLAPRDEIMDDYVPWTAADMSPSTRIRCRNCDTAFLKSEIGPNITEEENKAPNDWSWKDLPSGNWAEMMDFWHCHKPDPHEGDAKSEATAALKIEEQTAEVKGYGASSRVEAIPGTVLIDTATFLLTMSDCVGLKKSDQEENKSSAKVSELRTLECINCNNIIGMEDASASGWRLLKANVSLNTNSTSHTENEWQSHPEETIVAAQLLELIERESARRFVVHCGQKTGLLLWVFNPDLRYSNSSSGCSISAQQAMKVFYQATDDVEKFLSPELGKASPLSVEELELPSSTMTSLSTSLQRSNDMLPFSAKRFSEWQVGLLSRFSREQANSISNSV
ncbi:uncharacterized protein N7469_005487 [Penicillium citrinum]|uniref:Ubiquitin-conjugating enzyme E2-binding protein n=2 Tax=Penicillium TaxID=5073 RepID=A0A9W9TP27_PENCI|nr:uncharacterized protein N7469_005487 [Penicillium citrinum]KAJ5233721.1 hypothetical protein N7469_005487 [Penicillium citrinum]KAJ5572808.1 hypothetical protein N7450_009792 [Penicillium hetheringtonii]KAK5790284.1 hypothetical protein VI817_007571 [Penicillium citrinum]